MSRDEATAQGCIFQHYILTLNDIHSDVCLATFKPSARHIKILPTFNAAVRGDKGSKRKEIVALVRVHDGTNLQKYRTKTYEAKQAVIEEMEGEWKSSFEL